MEDTELVKSNTCEECGATFEKPACLKQHMHSHSLEQLPSLHPSAAGSSTAPISPPTLNHPPPYAEMIYAAITTLQEKGGSSKIAIGKHIEQTYSNLPANHSTLLTEQLHQLKNTGHLRMVKKSYKLPKPKTIRGCEPNAAVPKSRSPVGRPRKELPPLHPSAAASPAAPIAPPALNHPPPYAEMIYAAITTLKEKGGSSKIAIGKHIEQTYSNLPANHSTLLSEHLHQLKNTGHLCMVKKSYKLPRPKTSRGCEPNVAVPKSRRPVGRPRKQLPPLHPSAAASSPVAPPALNLPPCAEDEVVCQSHQVLQEHALTAELQQVRDDRDRVTAELQQVRDDRDRLTAKLTAELTAAKEKLKVHALTAELQEVRDDRDRLTAELQQVRDDRDRLTAELTEKIKMYECQLLEAEILRKKMHNNIMDLKGCIRVFCRVRPMLPQDGARQEESLISYSTSTEFRGRRLFVFYEGKINQFTFDKVFSPAASQQDVFGEVSELVQSVMDGYKVCIFAYGQTGSGKTYTMLGRPEASEKGLIPRSLEQIFQISRSLSAKGWNYKMQASMLEIYNGAIYDLLDQSTGSAPKKGLLLHLDANEDHYVGGLTVADVGSIGEIFSLLQQATQARSVGRTGMNEQSSRSHLVFELQISGVNEGTKQQVQGVLNFVDLAGSERVDTSGVVGDRFRETQEINLSLASLSKVILSLVNKEVHVPFRNSVLTRVLQPYLGKDSKTLMVLNISPNPSSVGESMGSLRFAVNANVCETGVVRPQQSAVRRRGDSTLKSPRGFT